MGLEPIVVKVRHPKNGKNYYFEVIECPFMFWAAYMTVSSDTVLVSPDYLDEVLDYKLGYTRCPPRLVNELAHIIQFRTHGKLFYIKYALEHLKWLVQLKHPHRYNKYEVESKELEKCYRLQLHKGKCECPTSD